MTAPAADIDEAALRAAIAAGTASHRHCHRQPAVPGETLLIRAGTLHAIGAGAFVYEIEQPSDLTFRISDWGRPTGRTLHVAEALRAIRPAFHAEAAGSGFRLDGGSLEVPEFRLELPDLTTPVARHPGRRSCEIVTAIRGTLRVTGDGWAETLAPYETLVVPAAVDAYVIEGPAGGIACVAGLP